MSGYVTPRRARAVRAELEEVATLDSRPFPDWSREPRRPNYAPISRASNLPAESPAPSLFDALEAATN